MIVIKSRKEAERIFNEIMQQMKVANLSNEEIIENLGIIIDLSHDFDNIAGTNYAINEGQKVLQTRELTSLQRSKLNYYLANAHSNLRQLIAVNDQIWQNKELESEIVHLRQALFSDKENELSVFISSQIFTNLGNLFSTCGRRIEALDYYEHALERDPQFSMARGNKGLCLFYYSSMLYDEGHIAYILKASYKELQFAFKNPLEDERAREIFSDKIKIIQSHFKEEFLESPLSFKEFSLGSSKTEKRYRTWILNNKLFLNPLNDIGPFSIAARDIHSVPTIVVKIEDPPVYQGFYNQLKQEFASARFLCYEGLFGREDHYSDKGVRLYNTLDYPDYSLKSEKLKIAYRVLYSIFDKIAYFLNEYFYLEIPEKKVYFKSIWYSTKDRKTIQEKFCIRNNPGINALFWLSRDLYDDNPEFSGSIEPEARELLIIRNHLEHKYLKLHFPMWSGKPTGETLHSELFNDTLAFSIYRSDFEKKTMKLLKLVRSALMYLSFAIKFEEMHREREKDPSVLVLGMHLSHYRE